MLLILQYFTMPSSQKTRYYAIGGQKFLADMLDMADKCISENSVGEVDILGAEAISKVASSTFHANSRAKKAIKRTIAHIFKVYILSSDARESLQIVLDQ